MGGACLARGRRIRDFVRSARCLRDMSRYHSRKIRGSPTLLRERIVYEETRKHMRKNTSAWSWIIPGFSRMLDFGCFGNRDVRIQKLLGSGIQNGGRRSVSAVLQLSLSMLATLRNFYAAGFVHGDVSADIFMHGRQVSGREREVFLIDFGILPPLCRDVLTMPIGWSQEIDDFFASRKHDVVEMV